MIGAGFVILLVFISYFALARSAGMADRKMEEIFRLSAEGEAGGLEEYEETKLCHYDWTEDGAETPCRAETCKTLPYDFQTYILNNDGSMYNEICEFTFDDEKTGHGYYYQANRDSENE